MLQSRKQQAAFMANRLLHKTYENGFVFACKY